jgi:hypothetical protein
MPRVKCAKSTRVKVQEHRDWLRAQGSWLLQLRVPNVRAVDFNSGEHRQSAAHLTLPPLLFPPSAALRTSFCAAERYAFRRRKRPFFRSPCSTILGQWPARIVSAKPQHPLSSRGCWAVLGRSPVDRPSIIFRNGRSPTIGRSMCRSRKPRSTCSIAGSAISSMNCSRRNHDLTRRHCP